MALIQASRSQFRVILAVTFGNILEWFEIYLYAYWAPYLSHVFFDFKSDLANLISMFVIFGAGFLARPIGAIFFGRLGDRIGRRRSFTLSITLLTIPTFLIGLLPTYAEVGILSPILLAIMRLLQSFPSAGEAPGAFCYLYEYADASNQKFMTSWGAYGNQVGAILSVLECFLMKQFMPEEFLLTWGWRISFWTGGLLGLLGIYLRHQLHETPSFRRVKELHEITKSTLTKVLNVHKKNIILGTCFGVVNAATFYLIASYIPIHFNEVLGLDSWADLTVTLFILTLTTVLLPVFGRLGDRYNAKKMMIGSTLMIIALLYPMYLIINQMNLFWIAFIGVLFIIPITCIIALLPYFLTNLFTTSCRFTCVGMSLNLADGIVGGFTPAIALALLHITGNQAAFCWYILVCAIVSLISYFKIKE
jgi:MHS family proline/betaine transporter-like MFS transporter